MSQSTQILQPSWIITVNENFDILEEHSLIIINGIIQDILPNSTVNQHYPDINHNDSIINLKGQVLLPGFINTHTHAAMSLLRGMGSDKELQSWLNDYIWPMEGKWVGKEFIQDGTLLACAEMIKSGTTCFNDMYFFPDLVGEIADKSYMRSCLSFPILEFPSVWAKHAEEYIDKGLAIHDRYKANPLISTAFGPHAPYTIEVSTAEKINTLAEELDCNIHMHLHENQQEVSDYRQQHGQSAIEQYAERGLLSPRLQAVHMTCLSEHEISLIKKYQVSVVHCPESNMKLASGICHITELMKHDIQVSLGTDGSASNNDLDMIGEMKSAALLAKVSSGNAAALNAQQTLRMATIEGAKTLGINNICGSLEIGKSADCISIDLSTIENTPHCDPVSAIIYSASKSQVSNVWVNGKQLLKEKTLSFIDENTVLNKARTWQQKIYQK